MLAKLSNSKNIWFFLKKTIWSKTKSFFHHKKSSSAKPNLFSIINIYFVEKKIWFLSYKKFFYQKNIWFISQNK